MYLCYNYFFMSKEDCLVGRPNGNESYGSLTVTQDEAAGSRIKILVFPNGTPEQQTPQVPCLAENLLVAATLRRPRVTQTLSETCRSCLGDVAIFVKKP